MMEEAFKFTSNFELTSLVDLADFLPFLTYYTSESIIEIYGLLADTCTYFTSNNIIKTKNQWNTEILGTT